MPTKIVGGDDDSVNDTADGPSGSGSEDSLSESSHGSGDDSSSSYEQSVKGRDDDSSASSSPPPSSSAAMATMNPSKRKRSFDVDDDASAATRITPMRFFAPCETCRRNKPKNPLPCPGCIRQFRRRVEAGDPIGFDLYQPDLTRVRKLNLNVAMGIQDKGVAWVGNPHRTADSTDQSRSSIGNVGTDDPNGNNDKVYYYDVSLHRSRWPGVGYGLILQCAARRGKGIGGIGHRCIVRGLDLRLLHCSDPSYVSYLVDRIVPGDEIVMINGINAVEAGWNFDQYAAAMRSTPTDCPLKLRLVRATETTKEDASGARPSSASASASVSAAASATDQTASLVPNIETTKESAAAASAASASFASSPSTTSAWWKRRYNHVDAQLRTERSALHVEKDKSAQLMEQLDRLKVELDEANRARCALSEELKAAKGALDAFRRGSSSGDGSGDVSDGKENGEDDQTARASPPVVVNGTLEQVEKEMQRHRLQLRELEFVAETLRSIH